MSKTYIHRRPPTLNNKVINPEASDDLCPYCGNEGRKEAANAFQKRVFVHMRCTNCRRKYSVLTR